MKKYFYCFFFLFLPILVMAQTPDLTKQVDTKLVSVGAAVNSLEYSEFSPTVSADGNTMIFGSDREGKGIWRLYITYQNKYNVWSAPQPFEVVNNFVSPGDFLGGAFLSYDGKTLFFTSDKKGSLGGIDIWYTQKTGTKWELPKNMGKGVNSSGYDGFPSLSADGRHLYFMREGKKNTPTQQRCCSIYVAEKRGGYYMNAKPLPYPVNTGCEGYPRIMADNKTIIFSSYRNEGKGGYDLYESKMRAGKWTKPVSLEFINTYRDDELISVPASGDVIYLSNTSSNGKDDIYKVALPKEFRPDKSVSLEGVIRDETTNKIIPATIKVNNINTKEKVVEIKNNEVTGKYSVVLQEGEKYDISISSKGRTFHSEVLDLQEVKNVETLKKDIKLQTLVKNTHFVLNNIFFGFDSANVKKDSELELERVVELMNANPTMNVEISAHTDDKGSDAYNNKLSQARAEAVVSFLVSKGIVKERLIAKGYGKVQPSVPNDSDENRAKNRRVEFKVIKI
jgi:OOP family OmpA-OmpF porin